MTDTFRCHVCNHVNSPEIQTFPEEYSPSRTFGPDPFFPELDICSHCENPVTEEEFDFLEYDSYYNEDLGTVISIYGDEE